MSCFSGSNATALITNDKALIWTDSRYYIQAEKELNKDHWSFMKLEDTKNNLTKYIKSNLPEFSTIAVNYEKISISAFNNLKTELSNYNIINDFDIVTNIDNKDKEDEESYNDNKVKSHNLKFAGRSTQEKMKDIIKKIKDMKLILKDNNNNYKTYSLIVTKLDDIACILKLNYFYRVNKFERK